MRPTWLLISINTLFGLTILACSTIAIVSHFDNTGDGISICCFVQLVTIVCALGFIGWRSRRRHYNLRKFMVPIVISILLLLVISIIGFYKHASVVGEFDNGGTWVPDKSVKTAAVFSLDTGSFIGSWFGYNCNTTYGGNCSGNAYAPGFTATELGLSSGIIVGNLLYRSRSKKI